MTVHALTVPWPPSVNRYWRHPNKGQLAGRHLISEQGRAYRAILSQAAVVHRIHRAIDFPCIVTLLATPPDRRERDPDNILKALLDGLTHAGVLSTDSCRVIKRLVVDWREPEAPGRVEILIQPTEVAT